MGNYGVSSFNRWMYYYIVVYIIKNNYGNS